MRILYCGQRLARRVLIAVGQLHLLEVGLRDDVVGERGFLGAGVHGRVALGRGNGLRQLAGLVVGVGGHDDGAARLRRVRMLAVDVLEFLGGVLELALRLQSVGVGEHLAGRIGVERAGGIAGAGATGERDDDGEQRKALQGLQHARAGL